MPELPEVEIIRRGIAPHLIGRSVARVVIREPRLRWPISTWLADELPGQTIERVERRGKYLLMCTAGGVVIVHLGMSGSLRMLLVATPPQKHDHFDLVLRDGACLRLRDPRRFSVVLWTRDPPLKHPLLEVLGPEPFHNAFNASYLYQRSRGRKLAVKNFIMDCRTVVGIGNIYASEALFAAGIHPARKAGRISMGRYDKLVRAIREVLEAGIRQGGTTLRDFVNSDGKPGYFRQQLAIYGRTGLDCFSCGGTIRNLRIGQRSSYFCPVCQR
jgi:formamidopyrimidine-DNA glycosylase